MPVPSPGELIETYGVHAPEHLAHTLGFQVKRLESPPPVTGITVFSAYAPDHTITLYQQPLQQLAAQRRDSLARLEQWHIAHELYHGLSEDSGISNWRVRETEADLWADELMVLTAE